MPDNATIDGNELEISFIEAASHTITFTNTVHSEFDVDLPLPITVPDGENILLPSVSGQFEDEDYIYTPSQWDIGEFGQSIYPVQDMTADLMWNREEIPETLPTVTIDGNLLLYTNADSFSSTTIQPNESVALYSQGSQYPFPANTTIACIAITFINVSGDKPIVEVWNNNGIAYLKNIGKTEASVKSIMPVFCNSSKADVVTVYNPNNVALYAFKYNLSGTDYYYVCTFSQKDWTNDLASIGYSLTPNLPTVVQPSKFYFNSSSAGDYFFEANTVKNLLASGNRISYDDSRSYAIQLCNNSSNSSEIRIGLPVVKNDIYIALRNDTGEDLNLSYALLCICSSNQATVVTVYDLSNNPFNAFKYNLFGIDYYYVLDGTQTSWTEDLSSIEYFLYPYEEITLYTYNGNKNVQPSVTSSYDGNVNTSYLLSLSIAKAGARFTYDLEKQYEFGYYNDSDEWVRLPSSIKELPDSTSDTEKVAYIMHDSGNLWICSNSENPSPVAFATDGVVKVRARKPNKMYITLYVNTNSIYDNETCNRGQVTLYGTPSLGVKSKIIPWQFDNTFPQITLEKVLGSTGNEIDKSNITLNRTAPLSIYINQASASLRSVLLSLDNSTFRGYLTTRIYEYLNPSTPINLMDSVGNPIPYEDGVTYKVVAAFNRNFQVNFDYYSKFTGNSSVEMLWYLDLISIVNNNGVAQATISSESVAATYLLIKKTHMAAN